jgi:hypothetical protein
MSIQAVLLPLFVEVILTFLLLYWMAHLRTSAFRKGDINAQDVALREPTGRRTSPRWATPTTINSSCRFCSMC